ncbi:MAG: hypothetical protein NC087_04515 [Anaeroplasma bactoclasticum]|nr:hypothetical protein [Anaeroplasma bactoclasticum]
MKKKIKDLTDEEINRICTHYKQKGICCKCPLNRGEHYILCKDYRLDLYGEEEVEIDE